MDREKVIADIKQGMLTWEEDIGYVEDHTELTEANTLPQLAKYARNHGYDIEQFVTRVLSCAGFTQDDLQWPDYMRGWDT